MLERTASTLVASTEAFAKEDVAWFKKYPASPSDVLETCYFNVIVTTAKLKLVSLDPNDISMKDGKIPQGASYTEIPFVRFRKQLSSAKPEEIKKGLGGYYQTLSKAKENTVFVVNSEHFIDFLTTFDIKPG